MLDYSKENVVEKISTRVPAEMAFPKVVLIDTVSFCNLKCSMCPHATMRRKPGKMSWLLYMKIIDEIALYQPDAQIWITFFGEGMILDDLPDKILYARNKGLNNIILNSNGNLMNREYSEKLIKSGLNGLYVGIDASTEDVYSKVRIGGNLEKVKTGVLEYKKLLDEFGKDDQNVIVQFVEMENNKHQVEEFVKFWNGNNIKCKIRPMVSWAGKVQASNLDSNLERLPCYWAMNTINITDQGIVTLCSVDLECQSPMGNINESSIFEVWNSSLKKFRNTQRTHIWNELPAMCRSCMDWQSGYAEYK